MQNKFNEINDLVSFEDIVYVDLIQEELSCIKHSLGFI